MRGKSSKNRRVIRNEKATLTTVFDKRIAESSSCGAFVSFLKKRLRFLSPLLKVSTSCSLNEKSAVSELEKNAERKRRITHDTRMIKSFIIAYYPIRAS